MCMYVYVHICVYLHRERERGRETGKEGGWKRRKERERSFEHIYKLKVTH